MADWLDREARAARALDMRERRAAGQTLAVVGAAWGVSRERVRQILSRPVLGGVPSASRRPLTDRPSWVTYAVACEGFVKVGRTTRVAQRFENLAAADLPNQTIRPVELEGRALVLEVVALFVGDREGQLLTAFTSAGWHVRGEWFRDSVELRQALAQQAA